MKATARVDEIASPDEARHRLALVRHDPVHVRRRQAGNWLLAVMVLCVGLFVVVLATSVVGPAMTTLLGAHDSSWSAAGP